LWPSATPPGCGSHRWTFLQRAIIKTLMTITLLSPGKGTRRAFDSATVQIMWYEQEAASAGSW
jgi:hypothetical protein